MELFKPEDISKKTERNNKKILGLIAKLKKLLHAEIFYNYDKINNEKNLIMVIPNALYESKGKDFNRIVKELKWLGVHVYHFDKDYKELNYNPEIQYDIWSVAIAVVFNIVLIINNLRTRDKRS